MTIYYFAERSKHHQEQPEPEAGAHHRLRGGLPAEAVQHFRAEDRRLLQRDAGHDPDPHLLPGSHRG